MKHLCGLILLVASQALRAGGYHGTSIDTYDTASGLYYRSIEASADERGFLGSSGRRIEITNINIFDPATGTSTLLFRKPPEGPISFLLFESGFHDGKMEFGGSHASTFVRNNTRITQRAPKDLLLIGVNSNRQTTLYISDKRGTAVKKLAVVPDAGDWHIDVRNSKLRIIRQTGQGLTIDNYEW